MQKFRLNPMTFREIDGKEARRRFSFERDVRQTQCCDLKLNAGRGAYTNFLQVPQVARYVRDRRAVALAILGNDQRLERFTDQIARRNAQATGHGRICVYDASFALNRDQRRQGIQDRAKRPLARS